jgi:catechol 2,3-dioxygenase-like lactoylglutathione lyase family enzyme
MESDAMRAIPVIRCTDVKRSLAFYTGILDFKKKYPEASDTDWVVDLVQGDAEIQLSQHAGDGAFGCAINLRVKASPGSATKPALSCRIFCSDTAVAPPRGYCCADNLDLAS